MPALNPPSHFGKAKIFRLRLAEERPHNAPHARKSLNSQQQ